MLDRRPRRSPARAAVLVLAVLVAGCSGSSSPSVPKSAAAAVSAIPSADPTPAGGRLTGAVLHKGTGGVNATYAGVSRAETTSYRAALVKAGWVRVGGQVAANQDGIDTYSKGARSIGVGFDGSTKVLTVAYY